MIAFSYGLGWLGAAGHAGWLQGLKLAAVAVVAQAVWTMAQRLCPDRVRATLALLAAAAVLAWNSAGRTDPRHRRRSSGGTLAVPRTLVRFATLPR